VTKEAKETELSTIKNILHNSQYDTTQIKEVPQKQNTNNDSQH
jgi:hypothetical protein